MGARAGCFAGTGPEISPAPRRVMGVTLDITERKRSEEKVRQSSHALEQSPVSVVITDLQGMIVYVNRKFCEVSGYSFAESVGQNPRILKSGKLRPTRIRNCGPPRSGKAWRGEFHNRKKNGELFWESAVIICMVWTSWWMARLCAVKRKWWWRSQKVTCERGNGGGDVCA